MTRSRLVVFVAACAVWAFALAAMATDSPHPEVITPATAPGVQPVPYYPETKP